MARKTSIIIAAEGLTEVTFIRDILRPHFDALNIWLEDAHDIRGGISLACLKKEIQPLLEDPRYDYVTTLIDYYGFKDLLENQDVNDLEHQIADRLKCSEKLIPYVQMHEFEALLFTDPVKIVDIMELSPNKREASLSKLQSIVTQFSNPEEINNSIKTAPSIRLESAFRRRLYKKRLHGSLIAQAIGLPAIREACPRFNQWISRLEALGNPDAR